MLNLTYVNIKSRKQNGSLTHTHSSKHNYTLNCLCMKVYKRTEQAQKNVNTIQSARARTTCSRKFCNTNSGFGLQELFLLWHHGHAQHVKISFISIERTLGHLKHVLAFLQKMQWSIFKTFCRDCALKKSKLRKFPVFKITETSLARSVLKAKKNIQFGQ